MAKKYITLEEAADRLGLSADELSAVREQGQIRGFADQGSWKFLETDIEEYGRSQEVDSSSDIPMFDEGFFDDESSSGDSDSDVQMVDGVDLSSSDSDVRLSSDDAISDSSPSTDSDIQLNDDSDNNLGGTSVLDFSEGDDLDSDSDVRLAGAAPAQPAGETGTDPDIDLSALQGGSSDESSHLLQGLDSDSDVRLSSEGGSVLGDDAADEPKALSDSDSDVRLSTGDDSSVSLGELTGAADSDLRLADDSKVMGLDSASDVALGGGDDSNVVLEVDSDSDVHLVDSPGDSDSDVALAGLDRTDSDIRLADAPPAFDQGATVAMSLPQDSDLKLIDRDESGITLEAGGDLVLDADESGITLDAGDSGISLDVDDSGINLEALDSGATLGDDSGITLDVDDDSGITLDAPDSGIALFEDDDSGISLDADVQSTQPMDAIPGAAALGNTAGTMQIDLAEETVGEDSEFELAGLDDDDDFDGTETSVLTFDEDTQGEMDMADGGTDAFGDDSYEDEFDGEDFDEDFDGDEMDDVWDADDDDDEDDGFESGESQVGGDFSQAAGAAAPAGWMVQDRPWGGMWTTFVTFGAILAAMCAFVGVELVRSMWMWTQGQESTSFLLDMIGGMFGK